MDPDTVSTFLEAWGYSALLLLLILTGVDPPISEDDLIPPAGYLLSSDVFWWPVAIAVTWGAAGAIALAGLLVIAWLRLRREESTQ